MSESPTERDPLELLAAEYTERLRQGHHPSISDYAVQHPELADEIRDLFPTIVITERMKTRQARSSDGRASLGGKTLERLGDFRLIREIGRGGMGVVFEAEQESLGRRVAVKVLPRQVLLDDRHLKRFQREARIAANLHHTNIVEVFGVGDQEGFHYYVMQFIEGVGLERLIPELARRICKTTLHGSAPSAEDPTPTDSSPDAGSPAATIAQLLLGKEPGDAGTPLPGSHYWRSVARIGLQAAEALQHAHSRGTLHRDIKPANLLLDTQGTVWLADFGLAKAAQSEDISLTNDIVGTLRYMAPEQFRGTTDHRSDIYSLGLTLYELLALHPAYAETSQSRLMHQISQGQAISIDPPSGKVPAELETIILKTISHDSCDRYSSAAALAEDLRCYLEDRPISARRVSPVERLVRWCRRNPSLATLSGTTLTLLLLVAVVASVGYLRTNQALRGEALARGRAEASASLAVEALDRIFERLSPGQMLTPPPLSIEGTKGETIEIPSSTILSRDSATLLEGMLPFYDRLARQSADNDSLRARTAEANRRLGSIHQRLGQFAEAKNDYQRAAELYQKLRSGSPSDPALRLDLARVYNELGRIHATQQQPDLARKSHEEALALLETSTPASPASAPLRFELARTCYFLGTRERPMPATAPPETDPSRSREPAPPQRNPDDRNKLLSRAVTVLSELTGSPEDPKRAPTDGPPHPEYQHLLALCYLEGATDADGRSQGRGGADRAIEILEALVAAFPNISDYSFDLSEACIRMHIPRPPIPPSTQEMIEARFARSLDLLEKLVLRNPDIPDYVSAAARTHHKLGSFQRQMDRWGEAEQCFRRAVALQTPLVKQFPDAPRPALWLATFRIALADVLIRKNQVEEARSELEATISSLLTQLKAKPGSASIQDILAFGYTKLEIALRQSGESDLAQEAARKSREIRNTLRNSR